MFVPTLARVIVSDDDGKQARKCEPVWRVIRRYRQRLGHSQYTLAKRLAEASGNRGLTREEVARWERGKRIPGPYWRHWLSAVLQVPQDKLDNAARCARKIRASRRT